MAWRLVPFLALLYLLAFLDRVNVGFAALTMNADLGFSPSVFGAGAGIFFLGYVLFGVPSNLMLHRLGARRWIGGLMICWGVTSAAMALIQGPVSFYALRFLLGVAEAGFFPGTVLYLTYWFPKRERTRILGAFMLALPLSSTIGPLISAALLNVSWRELRGWQCLFIFEGVPSILAGLVTLVYLADRPETAKWLDQKQRQILLRDLCENQMATRRSSLLGIYSQREIWIASAAYFALLGSLYGFSLWLPQVISDRGRLSFREVGELSMLPNLAAVAFMCLWSIRTRATWKSRTTIVIALSGASTGLALAAGAEYRVSTVAALAMAAVGIYCALPVYWSFVTRKFPSESCAAAGIALVNSIGSAGGYASSYAIGYLRQVTGSFGAGLVLLATSAAIAALLVATMSEHDVARSEHLAS